MTLYMKTKDEEYFHAILLWYSFLSVINVRPFIETLSDSRIMDITCNVDNPALFSKDSKKISDTYIVVYNTLKSSESNSTKMREAIRRVIDINAPLIMQKLALDMLGPFKNIVPL